MRFFLQYAACVSLSSLVSSVSITFLPLTLNPRDSLIFSTNALLPTATLCAHLSSLCQSGIEQNFGFLKDPVIVNSIFLKKPTCIEVLGLVLLIALLIWRLMERCMRHYLEKTKSVIPGWKDRPTKRPTSFMMTTKFLSILVAKSGRRRQLVKPLRPVQLEYLRAMGVKPEVFVNP
jgi:hypothetical protein